MSIPTQDYRRTDHRVPTRPLSGLDAVVNGIIGKRRRRAEIGEQLKRDAEAIDALASDWMNLSDHDLQTRLLDFRDQFRRGKIANETLFPALAAIREAAHRKLGLRPFPVQLM